MVKYTIKSPLKAPARTPSILCPVNFRVMWICGGLKKVQTLQSLSWNFFTLGEILRFSVLPFPEKF